MKKEFLNFIGTGSCFNTEFGNNSAYYFDKATNSLLLIDCGEDVFSKLRCTDLLDKAEKISVLITHMHTDHVGSLPSLIFYCHFVKNIVPTIIYPDEKTIREYLVLTGVDDTLYILSSPEEQNIIAIEQNHTSNIKAYGYILDINGIRIYYSGDTQTIQSDILEQFLSGKFDFFYQDTSKFENSVHLNIHTLASLIPNKKRKAITCMHFDDKETVKIAKDYGFSIA